MLLELKEIKFLVPVKFYRNVVLNKLILYLCFRCVLYIFYYVTLIIGLFFKDRIL